MTLRCDGCGKFVSLKDINDGTAMIYQVTPSSYFTTEEFVVFCKDCPKEKHRTISPVDT